MTTTPGLHDERRLLHIYHPLPQRQSERTKMLHDLANTALAARDHAMYKHLARDYRGWGRDGSRVGPGSGRASDWLDSGFRALAVLAETIHRDTGLRDGECRRVAHILHSRRCQPPGWGLERLPECPVDPVYWASSGYDEEFERRMAQRAHSYTSGDETPERVQRWILWSKWVGNRAIGTDRLRQLLARLETDPASTISGVLAESIIAFQIGQHGYEGCSGGELDGVVRDRPQLWDYLLSRAPRGVYVKDANGGVAVARTRAHEHEAETVLREAGYTSTLHGLDCSTTWAYSNLLGGQADRLVRVEDLRRLGLVSGSTPA
jgi:hypothetical protein